MLTGFPDQATASGSERAPNPLGRAEGEGFEPSIRLTTDNGFRDRYELADLQGF